MSFIKFNYRLKPVNLYLLIFIPAQLKKYIRRTMNLQKKLRCEHTKFLKQARELVIHGFRVYERMRLTYIFDISLIAFLK